jgi:hypothetical protein
MLRLPAVQAGGPLIGSDHFRTKGAVIVHLDDKNLPPARTASFCVISEHYFDIRYRCIPTQFLRGR